MINNFSINGVKNNEVKNDYKKICVDDFISSMKVVSDERKVFCGEIAGIPIVVDGETGVIYRDGRQKRELSILNGELYVLDKKSGWVKIFNNKGEFDFSRVKFTAGHTTAGTGYKAIVLCTKGFGRVKLRSHWLISAIMVNTLVLKCIGTDRIFEVNHIDGDNQNNRWDNLEIVTHCENVQHNSRVKYERMLEKFRTLGYIVTQYGSQAA